MNKPVKCMVWDLDNTLWKGTLAEGDELILDKSIVEIIVDLDRKGVLHSIASRNDFEPAWRQLENFNISHLFLYPQIHWHAKSGSVKAIAKALNLGVDSFYFIDDQPYEIHEVSESLPEVRCESPDNIHAAIHTDSGFPKMITAESAQRRSLYATELERLATQESFPGDNTAFLESLNLQLTISPLGESGINRAHELTERTNQLNTTGYHYTPEELIHFINSPTHSVLQAELEDKFGNYGTIGLCITERVNQDLVIRVFLLSCRVMNRSIAGPFLQHIKNQAMKSGLTLKAEYVPNGRNRQMLITYRFAGFQTTHEQIDGTKTLTHEGNHINLSQHHINLITSPLSEVCYG